MPYQKVKPPKPKKAKALKFTDIQSQVLDDINGGYEIRFFPEEKNKTWVYDPVGDYKHYSINMTTLNFLKTNNLVSLKNDPDEDGYERWS